MSEIARGDGLERLTIGSDGGPTAPAVVSLSLRPPHLARELAFQARTFSAEDGTSQRVVLLTAAGETARAADRA